MTPAREAVLREAEQEAAMLRRSGYPDAHVLPEYCIGSEIGPDNILTRTISIYVGEYDESSIRPMFRSILGLPPKTR